MLLALKRLDFMHCDKLSEEQKTAIVNSIARLENIKTVNFYGTPLLGHSLNTLLSISSLRSLTLTIPDSATFTIVMDYLIINTSIDYLYLTFNQWSAFTFKQVGQMLSSNKVLRTIVI